MRRSTLVKLGVGVVVIVVLPWLFLKTARDSIAAPYAVDEAMLKGWSLVLTDPGQTGISVLGLQPPPSLTPQLFDQVFRRTMESMMSPIEDVLPVVLHSEFQGGLGAIVSMEDLRYAAGDAGLEEVQLEPVCMGLKREPFVGRSRQVYFVLFEAPAVVAFRQRLERVAAERGGPGAFTAEPFDLVLTVGGSDPRFASWFPMTVDRGADCQAPLT